MINAFRHQRFLHQMTRPWRLCRLLVINAFRHQRFLHIDRLSCALVLVHVINAFRHQRFLHPRQIPKRANQVIVINAFRHQRFLHTVIRSNELDLAPVINAFRHQRFLHSIRQKRSTSQLTSDQRLSASKIFAQRPQTVSTSHIKLLLAQAPEPERRQAASRLPGNARNSCKIKHAGPFKQVFPTFRQEKRSLQRTYQTLTGKASCPHRHA